MLSILELNHVALHVQDVTVSCRFYGDILGLKKLPRPNFDFPGAWFALGHNQELHLIGDRTRPVSSQPRGNHFALKVYSVAETEDYLKSRKVDYIGPRQRPDGMWQIFLYDPDGHVLEFTELPA